MRVAIRVDAGERMGTGHVMRCLTLADRLRARGAAVRFVSRHLPSRLAAMLAAHGHALALLDGGNGAAQTAQTGQTDELAHAAWLGCSQAHDAAGTAAALADGPWDALVVDHYALDRRWETPLRAHAARLAVIDDLADRRHDCDILLDQNYYVDMESRYDGKVPSHAALLLGPRHVLLREEFRAGLVPASPKRGPVRRVLVFFGGVDAENVTMLALDALALAGADLAVDVVIGALHPHGAAIAARCQALGWCLHVQTERMAQLLSQADMAVGAGGAATWERCAMGVPSIVLILAENQREAVDGLHAAGVVVSVGPAAQCSAATLAAAIGALLGDEAKRTQLSQAGLALMAAGGASRDHLSLDHLLVEEHA